MGGGKLSKEGVQDGEMKTEGILPKETEEVSPEDIDQILPKEAETSEVLNGKNSKEVKKRVFRKSSIFTGPLPPPEIFEKYESICPGAADRIIRMAEKQMDHRQSLEKEFLDSRSRNSTIGIIAAFIIAITIIIVGGMCILKGHSITGSLFGGMGIATITTAFLKNTSMKEGKFEKHAEVQDTDIKRNDKK